MKATDPKCPLSWKLMAIQELEDEIQSIKDSIQTTLDDWELLTVGE